MLFPVPGPPYNETTIGFFTSFFIFFFRNLLSGLGYIAKIILVLMYTRNCPTCEKELSYKWKQPFTKAITNNLSCVKCTRKEVSNRPEMKLRNSEAQKIAQKGEKNGFYNKKHSQETKDKIAAKLSDINTGIGNPMYGKSVSAILKAKGDEFYLSWTNSMSKAMKGNKNPMYGKPVPAQSGRGVKGWYNGKFFRSLIELSYMLMLDRFNIEYISAERSSLKMKYISDNSDRTYVADFLVANKYLVECKPKSLWNTSIVKLKKKIAEDFCTQKGLKYKLVSPIRIDKIKLDELIESKIVTLL